MVLSIRDLDAQDPARIVDYFVNASGEFLRGMGVDGSRLPERDEWISRIEEERASDLRTCTFYYQVWCIDDQPVGHSSLSHIDFGVRAKMHLHLWDPDKRQRGLGEQFLRLTIPLYFERFELVELICEPYAHNPGPNRVLGKLGFNLTHQYVTVPGWINSMQEVNRYVLNSAESLHGRKDDQC